MTTLYENYITGDDSRADIYGARWATQTFTPTTAHTITSVKLLLYRNNSPGTVTVSIRTTSAGVPTGADLCSGTTNGNTLETASPYEWREITLGAGANLSASVMYAIVVRATAGNSTNNLYWRYDGTNATYTGGQADMSLDSGVTWDNPAPTSDLLFEDWGGVSGLPTVTTQAVSSIVTTTATGNGNVTDLGDSAVTQHGHCWNTTGIPDTDDSKTTNGAAAATGAFTSSLTGLTSGTLYYVRAYATNTAGTSYGGQVAFIAGALVPGEGSGIYAVVEERFHYVDAYGVERYVQGTVVP